MQNAAKILNLKLKVNVPGLPTHIWVNLPFGLECSPVGAKPSHHTLP